MDIAITTPIRTSMVSATIRRVCLKGITCKLFVTFDSLFVIVSTLELSIQWNLDKRGTWSRV